MTLTVFHVHLFRVHPPHSRGAFSAALYRCVLDADFGACNLVAWPTHVLQVFTHAPENINQYLNNAGYLETLAKQPGSQAADTVEAVLDGLKTHKPVNFADCITWARSKFDELFYETTLQLLHNFPADKLTTSGTPFWSPPKRCPDALRFDAGNEMHMEFIVAVRQL